MGLYGSMMMGGGVNSYDSYGSLKQSVSGSKNEYESLPDRGTINFTDYDDESGNYYLRAAASNYGKMKIADYRKLQRADKKNSPSNWMLTIDERESVDNEDQTSRRVKRQAHYESRYENEPPCYGFPLEVNIKSRIKMDNIFPIHGNSQMKKCIKVG